MEGSGAGLESARNDFPALKNRRNGKCPMYFDSACTTLVPSQVLDAVSQYYREFPACGGGRSRYWFAEEVTDRIDGNAERRINGSREAIKQFINARSEKEIVFTQNASHAINTVALGIQFRPGDIVLLTDREHNSNLLPWLRLRKYGHISVEQTASSSDGIFDLDGFEQRVRQGHLGLISMAYTTNMV